MRESQLWVHIPAVFLKNGYSLGEGKEALSKSRSLGGDSQASTADFPGSSALAVSHASVSDVHFSPTPQTCAPRAGSPSLLVNQGRRQLRSARENHDLGQEGLAQSQKRPIWGASCRPAVG